MSREPILKLTIMIDTHPRHVFETCRQHLTTAHIWPKLTKKPTF